MNSTSIRLQNESKTWPTNWFFFNDAGAYIMCDNVIPNKDIILTFKFKKEYPFKPPDVFMNGNNIIQYFKTTGLYYKDTAKILNRRCMCCDNLLCRNKWGPINKVNDIVKEILFFFRIKQRLMERYHCKKITDKYLKGVSSHVRIYEYYL